MSYQREQWHSGLTYQQICDNCKNTVNYTDHSLGFRPWYPDGYVDCPVCKSHLRHNENYAINAPTRSNIVIAENSNIQNVTSLKAEFCPRCGTKFGEGHLFCCKCGTKRN